MSKIRSFLLDLRDRWIKKRSMNRSFQNKYDIQRLYELLKERERRWGIRFEQMVARGARPSRNQREQQQISWRGGPRAESTDSREMEPRAVVPKHSAKGSRFRALQQKKQGTSFEDIDDEPAESIADELIGWSRKATSKSRLTSDQERSSTQPKGALDAKLQTVTYDFMELSKHTKDDTRMTTAQPNSQETVTETKHPSEQDVEKIRNLQEKTFDGQLKYVDEEIKIQVQALFRVLTAASFQHPRVVFPLLPNVLRQIYFETEPLSNLVKEATYVTKYVNPDRASSKRTREYPSTLSNPTADPESPTESEHQTIHKHEESSTLASAEEMNRRIQERLGFCLYRDSSTIPNAGDGTFIRGKAAAGTVVAFYPGIVYTMYQIDMIPDYPNISKFNDTIFGRSFDKIIIDGKAQNAPEYLFGHPLDPQGTEEEKTRFWKYMWCLINPFALGQVMNHPAKGQKNNVLPVHYTFDLNEIPIPSLRFVPNRSCISDAPRMGFILNWYYGPNAFGNPTQIPGLALITSRDVENEELFLNYRYNPKVKHIPSWYSDPEPEESARRWGKET